VRKSKGAAHHIGHERFCITAQPPTRLPNRFNSDADARALFRNASELVALNVEDLDFFDGGLRVTIRRSKTDQEGQGATIAIARGSVACPVDAVRAWIKATSIMDGPLFRPVTRTGKISVRRLLARAVAELVKAHARRAGLKAADFSGHSLRSGFLTSAAARGASIFKMMDVSRHKSVDTLRGYVRDAEMFRDHAGDGLL
jgi:integrase